MDAADFESVLNVTSDSTPTAPPPTYAEWLTTRDVSARTGAPEGTLRRWRHRGDLGPPWMRLDARTVRYHRDDVDAWLAARPRGGELIEAGA